MSDSAKIWCFLLLIPFLAVMGHDIYANFLASEEDISRLESLNLDPKSYHASELGYLLVTYTPGLYENIQSLSDIKIWFTWIDPLLRLYSFVVALIPFVLFVTWLLIARITDLWPFKDRGYEKLNREMMDKNKYEKRSIARSFKFTRR